jgi:hypothetical protein
MAAAHFPLVVMEIEFQGESKKFLMLEKDIGCCLNANPDTYLQSNIKII